jgi:glycosyltransferase involved in cell wall biosynthesis
MRILHIHQDYPDGLALPHTKAVSNLVAEVAQSEQDIEQLVLSVNRTNNPFKISFCSFAQGYRLVFFALPIPVLHDFFIWLAASWLHRKLSLQHIDVIHGHKLTTEGIFAYQLSKKLDRPYVISLRGGADLMMIQRFRQFQSSFRKVFDNAAKIFWVGPWAKDILANRGWNISPQECCLPNICNIDHNINIEKNRENARYITVLSFHQYKKKGILPLIEALAVLNTNGNAIGLDVYGGGDEDTQRLIQNTIDKFGCNAFVTLKGPVDNDQLLEIMSEAKGVLVPSKNETFGMVYIESLSVGTPILYHEKTGIDGYNLPGVTVTSQSPTEIARSIQIFEDNYGKLKNEVVHFNQTGMIENFKSKNITDSYITSMLKVLKNA